jgi:geranylgeranyl diphosphate synthase type I
MNVLEYLNSKRKEIDRETVKIIPENPKEVYGIISDYLNRGGKRLRPAICLLSCEAVGGDSKKILPIAASIELFHLYTLLHDDIEDNSDMRRGKPTAHRIYGIPLAVNAGDGLFPLILQSITRLKMPPEKIIGAQSILSNAFRIVLEGQGVELNWYKEKRWDINEEDYFKMVSGKTGKLIGASCEVGAFLGGASKKQQEAVREFGERIGIAFQIQDDILNIVGNEEKYGKEIGGDISEGKRTLMVIYTLKKASKEDRGRLIQILDEHTKDQAKLKEVIQILKKYNSHGYAKKIAENLIIEAKKKLEPLPKNEASEKLLELADFFIDREV